MAEDMETHAGGTAENPTYRDHGYGRLPVKVSSEDIEEVNEND